MDRAERVQKLIARAGFASRRQADGMVAAGRVTVNGAVAVLGTRADPVHDVVELDGVAIDVAGTVVVYALHKPAGVITTAADPRRRPTVIDLVPDVPRVFPIGRLDIATEGLLLLTNDGDLAHAVAHPSHRIDKEYLVEVSPALAAPSLRRLERGIELDDGMTAPARVSGVATSPAGSSTQFRLTIREGRNRQVRRMVAALGSQTTRLARTRIGTVSLGRLRAGEWRALPANEIDQLRRALPAGRSVGADG